MSQTQPFVQHLECRCLFSALSITYLPGPTDIDFRPNAIYVTQPGKIDVIQWRYKGDKVVIRPSNKTGEYILNVHADRPGFSNVPVTINGPKRDIFKLTVVTTDMPMMVKAGSKSNNELEAKTRKEGQGFITLVGGNSSLNTFKVMGRIKAVGGSNSRNNFISNDFDGDILETGGDKSTNDFFLENGSANIIGGKRAKNIYHINPNKGRGKIASIKKSTNIVIVLTPTVKPPDNYELFGIFEFQGA
jgi:hypothetical protein